MFVGSEIFVSPCTGYEEITVSSASGKLALSSEFSSNLSDTG